MQVLGASGFGFVLEHIQKVMVHQELARTQSET